MDYLNPHEAARGLVGAAAEKVNCPGMVSFMRGVLAVAVLALAVTFACAVSAESHLPYVGALVFPAGFAAIIVTGIELYTATSALGGLAAMTGGATLGQAVRASALVYLGNLIGGLVLAWAVWAVYSMGGKVDPAATPAVARLCEVAAAKVKYSHYGATGWWVAFLKAVLCNFSLCSGVVLAAH
jgi:formate/nitrite transporter FocA (FNT family)